jgi:hypothetical protein
VNRVTIQVAGEDKKNFLSEGNIAIIEAVERSFGKSRHGREKIPLEPLVLRRTGSICL